MTETHRINRNGVEYDLTITEIKDQCMACNGLGFIPDMLHEDYRRHDMAIDRWVDGGMGGDPPEIEPTGKLECARCQGTGVHEGDGPVLRYSMKSAHDFLMLPLP